MVIENGTARKPGYRLRFPIRIL